MRYALRSSLVALAVAGISIAPTAHAQEFSLDISTPNVRIGINVPTYPNLIVVPGYPVYYAPQLPENYFFYDGLYWVYVNDGWYCSDWYNGPWSPVAPEVVPDYILRVPVRYYRVAPPYFRGWSAEAPPHWGEHWGPTWQRRRAGWDRADRRAAPPPAPLPTYQRAYSGSRYPSVGEQSRLQAERYRYEPHEAVVREAYAAQREHRPATRNEPPGQHQQRATEQRAEQQRQAAQQRDRERKDSEREAQRRTAEQRDEQQRHAAQQREQQHRDAEQRPQAAQPREPQRKEADREQQQRQAAQQQREQQQRRAAEQRDQRAQAAREKELPRSEPAPQQHDRLARAPAVQSADRSERGTPPPGHPREREPGKKVDNSHNADDASKGERK